MAFFPSFPASLDVPNSVLIDVRVSNAICVNAATAFSQTSLKEPIEVSFSAARPPALSRFAFYIYDRPTTTDLRMQPKVISADGNLVVIRVPQDRRARVDRRFNDYFVYRIQAQRPELYLLPAPGWDVVLADRDVAILNCGGGGDYVVAALKSMSYRNPIFKLHLCRTSGGIPGHWTSQVVSVGEPLRDSLYPIPDSAGMQAYHVTTKVITLGGSKGTVGWVDLWRGIILCDVLSENLSLREMPLPSPSGGCEISFRNADPCFFRDIVVNHRRDTLKFIEMDIRPKEVPATSSTSDPPLVVAGSWKATTYKMPVPATSSYNWEPVCFIRSKNLKPSFREHRKLLQELMSSSDNKKQREATLSLSDMQMAYPALSVGDDNIVYMLCRGTSMVSKNLVVGVDVGVHTMNGVAKIDSSSFFPHYLVSGIYEHHLLKKQVLALFHFFCCVVLRFISALFVTLSLYVFETNLTASSSIYWNQNVYVVALDCCLEGAAIFHKLNTEN